jgi:3-oxoacyl-[acyl-carrier protein] reductase|tara:strand:- start:8125 stop:8865 length:741 start_codon:yes stop_codon:yes gene_type:complete
MLQNKTAVITGSNRGIGKKILEKLSENKATIFACTRKINEDFIKYINSIMKKYNNEIIPIEIDLSDEDKTKKGIKNITNSNKNIDIIVNNAGAIHTALFNMTPQKILREIFEINFFSQSLLTQSLVKSMIKTKKGSIIYISSTSAIDGNEGRSAYSASKAAIISQAKVLSKELGNYNIRVNIIAPGLTKTNMMEKNTSNEVIQNTIKQISLKRIASPDEIANVVLFLASDLSAYISGQVIRVDGGM